MHGSMSLSPSDQLVHSPNLTDAVVEEDPLIEGLNLTSHGSPTLA
jgi:hypothetical protein